MSVERRENPKTGSVSFVVRWRAGGRAASKSFSAQKLGGEKRAEKLARKYDLEVSEQLVTTGVVVRARGAQTLSSMWQPWYDAGCATWTAETQEAYASAMDVHILPRLGGIQLAAIKPATIERWIADLQRAGVGPAAVRKSTTVLSSLLSYAVRDDLIDVNPVRVARKAPAPRKRTPQKITPEQVETMRAWFTWQGLHGDAALLSLLAYAGLRPESEALVLDWRDVGRDVLHVRPNRKRGARPRQIRLLDPLRTDLLAWRRRVDRLSGPVLPFHAGGVSTAGEQWTGEDWNKWRRNRWSKAAQAAGLPSDVIPRDLRGSFASLLIWEGRSVIDVARQCGHKPSTCLDVYAGEFAEFDPVERRPAVDLINEARIVVAAEVDFGADVLARDVASSSGRPRNTLRATRNSSH